MSDLEQRSDEWFRYKAGKISASRMDAVVAAHNTASYQNYLWELVVETITGEITPPSFRSDDTDRGNELEDDARGVYEVATGSLITTVGFIDHPTIPMCGCSPDGLVGDNGGVEIKSPKIAHHAKTVLEGFIKPGYRRQIQWNIDTTQREWWDYVSYCPGLVGHEKHIIRVYRDEKMIAELTEAVLDLRNEVDKRVAKLRAA